jgi:RNA polymerase sigma factor (sigma-70 family)
LLEPHTLLEWVEDRVARWGRHLHLQAADVDDMRQVAAAAALRALSNYNRDRVAGPPELSLHALLRKAVDDSLAEFLRARCRLASHHDATADVARLLEGKATGRGGARPLVVADEDLAQAAQAKEEVELLDAAVEGLADDERRLLELWLSDESLRQTARLLDVGVKVVRGRREKLLAKLRAAVRRPPG